ncbi:hypothetical protein S7711_10697 [Stachybotrys chartarum IBT 7711]|uniref:Uncharacterized protein n=1 Tax=Stachybotrys chartarum (strain CBS 109288 / IBT 7711) TaxID=1280523 RepID=A0A084AUT0_STACB|nr:hypothetical protein S7711_10697 [Stachybotrys chartarum IBT 7711]
MASSAATDEPAPGPLGWGLAWPCHDRAAGGACPASPPPPLRRGPALKARSRSLPRRRGLGPRPLDSSAAHLIGSGLV